MRKNSKLLRKSAGAAKAAVLAVLIACAPLGAQSASAVSDYDNTIVQGDYVANCWANESATETNLSTTAISDLMANNSTFAGYMDAALAAGKGWAVVQTVYTPTGNKNIEVYVDTSPESDPVSSWGSNYESTYLTLSGLIRGTVSCGGDGTTFSPAYSYTLSEGTRTLAQTGTTQNHVYPVFINMAVTYPEGYQGIITGTEYEIPVTAKNNQPKADVTVNDKEIIMGFNPDELPIKEAGISITVTDPTGKKVIDNESLNSYEGWVKRFTVSDYGLYNLHAEYYVPIPYIMPEEVNPIPLDIPINVNGDLFSFNTKQACNEETGVCSTANVLKPCITTTAPDGTGDQIAPYLNIPNCAQNVFSAMHILAFKTVKFKEAFTNPNECTTLGTVGEWLKLENKTVCANFPSALRNVITPFIIFALSLMAIKGLTRPRFTT